VAAETGFLINDSLYEVPTLESLDNDECVILFDYSGLVQEDFVPLPDETEQETNERNQRQMKHPGFWKALMHIAYRRRHRDVKDDKVKALIGTVNRLGALSTLAAPEPEDGEAVPPALTSEQHESSPSGSLENATLNEQPPVNGGNGSTTGSAGQDATPALTGTGR
jgi:hypothetical protein